MKANYKSYSDAQLAKLINQHDRGAFNEIYARYWPLLYIHAKNMLHDEDQAKDIVQELFTNLLAKMGSLQLASTIKAFLYKSTRNMVLNLIKHNKVKIDYISSIQAFYQEGVFTTDEQVRENELKKEIEKEIERLPAKMRTIFEMSRKTYLSNLEIAHVTNTSEENVRKQLYKAVIRVKAKLTSFLCLQIMATIMWLNNSF
jgi:RNA polymerase sigma-70 factor (ECF subfamily)